MILLQTILHSSALFWSYLALFILLNIMDAHSTYIVMYPNHYYREKNPIARIVFKKLGCLQGVVIFKTVLLGILIPAMLYYAKHDLYTINIVLSAANLVFALVVINNYRIYHKHVKKRRVR